MFWGLSRMKERRLKENKMRHLKAGTYGKNSLETSWKTEAEREIPSNSSEMRHSLQLKQGILMKAGSVPTGMQMNALLLFLRPRRNAAGPHREFCFQFNYSHHSIHPSIRCIYARCYAAKASLSASRQVNAWAVGDLGKKKGRKCFVQCSYPCLVSIVNSVFFLESLWNRRKHGGVHALCFPLSCGNRSSTLFNLADTQASSTLMTSTTTRPSSAIQLPEST